MATESHGLNDAGPDATNGLSGDTSLQDSVELAGTPLASTNSGAATSAPKSSRVNTLTVSLVAVIAILIVALVFALIRPWDNGSSASEGSHTGAGTATASAQPAANLDSFQSAEADIASEKGWVAGTDYIPSQAAGARQAIASLPKADDASGMALGPADAPVFVRVFADFSCPICARLHNDSFKQLEDIARAGDIRLEYANFVIFDQQYGSGKPARGALAAAQQGKMWEFIDTVFAAAGEGDHPVYTDESVAAFAQQAGVPDMAAFATAYASQEVADAVSQQTTMATNLGLTGTPAMLIGSSFIGGYADLSAIEGTISMQKELAQAGVEG
ncbi:thioredoxin domain-containing protein [Arcanobacterium haemolyticum]|nr:thioredoxin domain-containing protein [Arcanobacterium haemolyticum]